MLERGKRRREEEKKSCGWRGGRNTHKEVICGRDDTLCVAGACTLLRHLKCSTAGLHGRVDMRRKRNICLIYTGPVAVFV